MDLDKVINLLKKKGFSDTYNILWKCKNYKAELHEFYKELNKISNYNSFLRIKEKLLQKNLISIKKYKGKRFIGLTNKGIKVYNKLIEINDILTKRLANLVMIDPFIKSFFCLKPKRRVGVSIHLICKEEVY